MIAIFTPSTVPFIVSTVSSMEVELTVIDSPGYLQEEPPPPHRLKLSGVTPAIYKRINRASVAHQNECNMRTFLAPNHEKEHPDLDMYFASSYPSEISGIPEQQPKLPPQEPKPPGDSA